MFLLDTMVVSDPTKTRPDPEVGAWLRASPPSQQFVSVLSMGEVQFGIRRLPPGARRERLNIWFRNDLTAFFGERTLPIDAIVADVWSGMRAAANRTVAPIDGLIAATALAHGLTIVSRNVRNFAGLGAPVLDPWR